MLKSKCGASKPEVQSNLVDNCIHREGLRIKPESIANLPNLPQNKVRKKDEYDSELVHIVSNNKAKHAGLKKPHLAYLNFAKNEPISA